MKIPGNGSQPASNQHLAASSAQDAAPSTSTLPVHDAIPFSRRILETLAITATLTLIVLNVGRLATADIPVNWFTWFLIPVGMAAADFLSGLIHWGADTWGRESMPLIGRRLLHPFRVHHVNQADFLERRFIDTNGDVAILALPGLVGISLIPLETTLQYNLTTFCVSFLAVGSMTNQIHQWAHMPQPPWLVKQLQNCGILLGRNAHALHHSPPYTENYCITTGWCNRPLASIDFFRRLERGITRVTGYQPRSDEEAYQEKFTNNVNEKPSLTSIHRGS